MSASTHRSFAIRTQHGRALLVIAVLLSGVLIGMALLPAWTRAAAPDPVTAAWQRAKAAGNYRFTSDITQVTLPLATVANVGHTSRTDPLHLERRNDLRARQMAFTLWSDGGNVLQAESGVSVRMEDGQTYARRGAGEWEIVDDMTGAIAPQGDFMSFLAAVKDVTAQPAEQRGGITFTRYTFQIDSPRLALYLHEQTVAALRARGELPNGIQLEAPAYFRDMAGSGELWVGDDGLPLRQIHHRQHAPGGHWPGGVGLHIRHHRTAIGGIIAPNLPYYSAVTASRPDRQDNYHITAMAFDNLNSPVLSPIGRGDILAYTLPAGTVRAIENDANNTRAFMGATAPSMATNTAGDAFAAWGQQRYCNTVTFNSIRVTTAGADGQDASPGIEPIIALTPNGGTESFAWRWDTGGGSMTGGQQRGPGANGFPVSAEFCNGTVTFRVYDNDGANNELMASQSVFMYTPVNGDVTFTGAGHTIVVNMTIPVIDRFVIAGALLGPDGQVKRSITFPRSPVSINALRGSFGPAVASDGDGFLIAYESYAETAPATPGSPQIVVQAFDKDGNPLQSSYQAAGSAQASDPQYSSIALDAAWIGYAYRVVWQDRSAAQVRAIDVVHDGSSMSGPLQFFGDALTNAGINYGPSVAYNPLTGRVLTVFLSDVRRVIGILQNGGAVIGNPLVLSLDQFPSARSPQVAWHPGYRGWLVSYQDETASQRHLFVPVNADGVQAFPAASGFFIAANDNSLACPAPQSAPAVELRFEELPGAATFADASGRANNATCTGATCPLTGLAGAPNAPLSDYAAQFDGVDNGLTIARTIQDNFSVAFWIKAPPSTGQRTIVDGGNIASNGFAIRLNSGGVSVYVPGVSFQTIQRVDDDQWHFVVVSRNNASGQVDIYIDGALVRGLPGAPGVALTNAATLRIGVKPDGMLPLRATLDHLQIIPAALAADTVLAMYNRTLQSYCVAAGTRDSNVYWARVQATQPDVRGGRVSASNALRLTIDADLPTAQFAALQNGAIVGLGQVIGGSASDPTSGVGLVEVSINNGAWQPTTGADAWAFSLAGQSGAISLRVRATDRVGNVGAASAPLNLVVDTVAPVVSVVVPPATLKPTKNAEGRWQINLSGAASDASGVNPASLLVRLEQQSGVGMAQSMQQAVLNGANWSIGYLLDAGLYDPTGAYTVTVQAADSVGNQATPATAVLRLDAREPEATLSASDTARQAISQTLTIGGVLVDTDSNAGVNTLEIAFTAVEQIAALPAGLTSAQAEAQLNRAWAPVNLAQRGPAWQRPPGAIRSLPGWKTSIRSTCAPPTCSATLRSTPTSGAG